MVLIDIGANLTHKSFNNDQDDVLLRAYKADVAYVIITGTSLAGSEAAIKLANKHPMYSATAGIHPHDAKSMTPEVFKKLSTLAHSPKVKAVGECGLDFNRMFSTKEQQINAFELQLVLAQQVNLPLFLHERDAVDKFTEMLKLHEGKIRGVVHCFTGNRTTLKAYLDLGMHIGITGWICDERRNQDVKDALNYVPLDRLMVETDAPFLTPKISGKSRNEPAFLVHVVNKIASILNKTKEEIADITTANALRLFGRDGENGIL